MSSSKEQQQNRDPCVNPGNPVFSCMFTPEVKEKPALRWTKPQNLLYRTTNSAYGLLPPTPETSTNIFHPKTQKFTEELARSGMYRDNGFNTAIDRSRVYDCPNFKNTI